MSKISKIYDNYDEAISECNADWIYVSTKNDDHFKLSKSALNSGRNVIVDKPAILSLNNGYELIDIANKRGLYICEATVFTYHTQFSYVSKFHKENKVEHISAHFSFPKFDQEVAGIAIDYGCSTMRIGIDGTVHTVAYAGGSGRHC